MDGRVSMGVLRGAAITLITLIAFVALLWATAPPATAASLNAVIHSPAAESRTDAGPLWTERRMRSAPARDAAGGDADISSRRARALSRGLGIGSPEVVASTRSPMRTVDGDRKVKAHTTYPQRTHGRIFATTPGIGDFTCSGTVVSSNGRNVVYTAGHCLYDKESGQFATNVVFVPAYKRAKEPYGAYAASDLLVLGGWADLPFPDAYSYDVAVMTLALPLERLIGARGLRAFVSPRKKFDIYGYPARPDPPYDGERPIHCPKAEYVGRESQLYPVDDPSVIAGPCFMQQGSSGGGWVIKGGFVNSVVSHGFCDSEPRLCGLIHGPYFAENAANLYEEAGGGNARPSHSDACKPLVAEVRKAKKAKKRAAKARRRAKRKVKKVRRSGSARELREAQQGHRAAKERLREARSELRRARKNAKRQRC